MGKWKWAPLKQKRPRGCLSGSWACAHKQERSARWQFESAFGDKGRFYYLGGNYFHKTCHRNSNQRVLIEQGGKGEGVLRQPLGRPRATAKGLRIVFKVTICLECLRVGENQRASRLNFPSARGPAGRGTGEGTISPGGGAHGSPRGTRPKTRSVTGCLVGAAEVTFPVQFDKGALIGQCAPAVVGRKESSLLIGRSAPAMRQGGAGVEGSA